MENIVETVTISLERYEDLKDCTSMNALKKTNEELQAECDLLREELLNKEVMVEFILASNFKKSRIDYDSLEEMLDTGRSYFGMKNYKKLIELGISLETQKEAIKRFYEKYTKAEVEESEEVHDDSK